MAVGSDTPKVILKGIPKGFIHNGGRMVVGPDGYLYVGTGESGRRDCLRTSIHLGKILRIRLDGRPAPGNAVLRQTEMHDRWRRDAHFWRDAGVRFQELEVVEHRVIGGKIELADNPVAFRPGLDAMEFDAVIEQYFLDAGQAPAEIEMPPGAAIFAVGRELEAHVLLLLDYLLDLGVFDSREVDWLSVPLSRLARLSLMAALRRIEPTWSARKGGLVRGMMASPVCRRLPRRRGSITP